MKHLKQLVEYITGMDTRIGYPSEHLAGDTQKSDASPILATAVGLLMNALLKHIINGITAPTSYTNDLDDITFVFG